MYYMRDKLLFFSSIGFFGLVFVAVDVEMKKRFPKLDDDASMN